MMVDRRTPAVSVWQPWASLIAAGAKRYETKTRPTRYTGPLVIYAAKRWGRAQWLKCREPGLREAIEAAGMTCNVWCGANRTRPFPLGGPVALVSLSRSRRVVVRDGVPFLEPLQGSSWLDPVPEGQVPLGDFSHGRHAWDLDSVVALDFQRFHPSLDLAGKQGFFRMPPEVVESINAQLAEAVA